MNVEFEKEYLVELYEKGKTDDKKHRFQPEIVNGYLKCVKYSIFFSSFYGVILLGPFIYLGTYINCLYNY